MISRLLTMLSNTSLPKCRRQSRARSSRVIRRVFTVATTIGIDSPSRLFAAGDRRDGSGSRASVAASEVRAERSAKRISLSVRPDGSALAGEAFQ